MKTPCHSNATLMLEKCYVFNWVQISPCINRNSKFEEKVNKVLGVKFSKFTEVKPKLGGCSRMSFKIFVDHFAIFNLSCFYLHHM